MQWGMEKSSQITNKGALPVEWIILMFSNGIYWNSIHRYLYTICIYSIYGEWNRWLKDILQPCAASPSNEKMLYWIDLRTTRWFNERIDFFEKKTAARRLQWSGGQLYWQDTCQWQLSNVTDNNNQDIIKLCSWPLFPVRRVWGIRSLCNNEGNKLAHDFGHAFSE